MEMHLPASLNPTKLSEALPHKVRKDFSGKNVGTLERFVSGALGFLVLRSAMKRGVLGKALMIPAALALFKRAATGKCELYQAAGLSSTEESKSADEDSVNTLKGEFGKKSLDAATSENRGQPLAL